MRRKSPKKRSPRKKSSKNNSNKPYSVTIKKSTNPKKKYMAIFYNKNGYKIKTTHFGAKGYSDFTKHKDEERKQRYINRHRKRENWNNPMTAGSLSRYILWEKPTFTASKNFYKRKFKLK